MIAANITSNFHTIIPFILLTYEKFFTSNLQICRTISACIISLATEDNKDDLKIMETKSWHRVATNLNEWIWIVLEAKAHSREQCWRRKRISSATLKSSQNYHQKESLIQITPGYHTAPYTIHKIYSKITSDGASVSHFRSMQIRHVGIMGRRESVTTQVQRKIVYYTNRTPFEGEEVFVNMISLPSFIQFKYIGGDTKHCGNASLYFLLKRTGD